MDVHGFTQVYFGTFINTCMCTLDTDKVTHLYGCTHLPINACAQPFTAIDLYGFLDAVAKKTVGVVEQFIK